jgi:hypothetical protein
MVGINIQAPWSYLLINGEKCVETRSYPLPKKYEGEELALIETPGKNGDFEARIIGTITFSHSFEYPDANAWKNDYARHLVEIDNVDFGWKEDKEKHGWVVSDIKKLESPQASPKNKGIIFTLNCDILIPSGV